MRTQGPISLKDFLGLLSFYFLMFFMIFIGLWILLTWAATGHYLLLAVYLVWYFYDRSSPETGGYSSELIRRRWPVHQWFSEYFNAKVHKTAELSPENNYLMVYHPHGVAALGTFAHFSTYSTGFQEKFPGINVSICGLHLNFQFPFRRELLMLYGYVSCSKKSIEHILTRKGKGQAAVLVVGGAEESLDAHPGRSTLILAKRKGFVREALITGAHLVPVYSFGENDVYRQAENPPGSMLREFQNWAKKTLGFTVPMCYGRGFFQNYWGPVPLPAPINTVIGAPIPLDRVVNPSKELIDDVHKKYMLELTKLFDDHKTKYGYSKEQQLVLQ